MARILVTYGWCRTAYIAVKSLARSGHTVHVCSHLTPSMAGWSRFAAASFRCANPFKEGKRFTQEIADWVVLHEIDLVLPIHEDALVLREHEELLPSDVIVGCPSKTALKLGLDKHRLTCFADKHGIAVPQTRQTEVEELIGVCTEFGYPLVVKLRFSNSAKGVFFIEQASDVKSLLESGVLQQRGKDALIVQRFHRGAVVGACFLADAGNVVSQFHEIYIWTKNEGKGTSVYRKPMPSDRLAIIVSRLVKALNWTGIGHFDFIKDEESGNFLLLEMNPRPWGAINLAYVNGYDFISAWASVCLQENKPMKHFSPSEYSYSSLWLVGQLICCVEIIKKKKLLAVLPVSKMLSQIFSFPKFDDLEWSDPVPLIAESLCYAKGFLLSGGKTNPD